MCESADSTATNRRRARNLLAQLAGRYVEHVLARHLLLGRHALDERLVVALRKCEHDVIRNEERARARIEQKLRAATSTSARTCCASYFSICCRLYSEICSGDSVEKSDGVATLAVAAAAAAPGGVLPAAKLSVQLRQSIMLTPRIETRALILNLRQCWHASAVARLEFGLLAPTLLDSG